MWRSWRLNGSRLPFLFGTAVLFELMNNIDDIVHQIYIISFNSRSAPTKFVPLSEWIVTGMPKEPVENLRRQGLPLVAR